MMNCKQARNWIALSVGSDLPDADEKALQSHLRGCNECCRLAKTMRSTLEYLKRPVDPAHANPHDSIWPSLSGKLPARIARRSPSKAAYWLPTTAVLSASVALILLWRSPLPLHQPEGGSMAVRGSVRSSAPTYNASVSSPYLVDFLRPSRMPFQSRQESPLLPPAMRDSSPWTGSSGMGAMAMESPGRMWGSLAESPIRVHPEHFAGDVDGVPLSSEDPQKRSLDIDPMHFSD